MNYQVILVPQDASDERVAAFVRMFKSNEEKVRAYFSRAPMVLKSNIDADNAEKYRSALARADIQCEIKPMQASAAQDKAKVTTVVAKAAQAPPPAPAPVAAAANIAAVPNAAAPVAAGLSANGSSDFSDDSLPGLKFRIEGRPDFAFLTVKLPANKTLKVEASAMATMDTHIQMKSKLRGGLGRMITGESIVMNEFTAADVPGEIGIAPPSPGDLRHVYLNGETIFLQNSAFVASDPEVAIESKWQGFTKGFFSGENLFLIRAQGTGDLWFNSYGGIIDLDVDGDYVVDTGNIVAFTEGLEYKISKVGGYKSLFFSGEGFVCRFSGKGKIWIQTRAAGAFASWAHPFRPVKSRG